MAASDSKPRCVWCDDFDRAQGGYVPCYYRFWDNVRKTDTCWLWKGECNDGYGRFYAHGGKVRAHRFAWQMIHGRLAPKDMMVCHRCDVRPCVRPDHLYLGTHADNMFDLIVKFARIRAQRK